MGLGIVRIFRDQGFPGLPLVLALVVLSTVAGRANAEPHVPAYVRFLDTKDNDSAAAGRLLLGELNCVACHQTDDATSAAMHTKQAPILSEVAQRVKPDFFAKYLADPHAAKAGTTMPDVLAGLSDEERKHQATALAHFLTSLDPTGPPQAFAAIGGRTRGERLYHTAGCAVCHGSRAEGAGLLPTDKPLGNLAEKYTLPSLADFLQDPLHTRPSGRMPSLNLSSIEARDIAAYLLPKVPEKTGLAYKYYEGSWDKLPDFDKLEPNATGGVEKIDVAPRKRDDQFALQFEGALAIDKEGDYTFHVASDDGSRILIDGKLVVDNDGIHGPQSKSGKVNLTKGVHLVTVDFFEQAGGEEVKAEFEGPGIARQEIASAIVAAQPDEKIEPYNFTVDAKLAAQGRELFATAGCASCHQLREKEDGAPIASGLAGPPLAKLPTGKGCLSESPGKGAADYQLSASQRQAIAAALATIGKPAQLAAKEQVHSTMVRLNCYACHERDKIGGPLEDQLDLFAGTQPEMGDEGRLPPPLDGVGGKLTAAWLSHVLADGTNDRPFMLTRMPKFGEQNAGQLQRQFAELDALEPLPPAVIDEKEAKIAGWRMVGDKGFGCIKCHTFGRFAATGVQSMDMTLMHKRLRGDWFRRYVDDPSSFRQGTRMPDAWPSSNGKSLLPNFLDGQNATQIQAVWQYLSDGPRARTPEGLASGSMELIPTYEAILYRNFIQDAGPRAIGVGYPEQMSLAFDANRLRLALLWQGAFIDPSKHWNGRGQGFQGPAGQKVHKLPAETTFAVLESEQAAWPTGDPREQGGKFIGYRLSEDRRPTFIYSLDGVRVEDFPTPVEDGAKITMKRSYIITADDPPGNLYLRAAAAGSIKKLNDGWYDVDGQMKVRITGGEPTIRDSGGKRELLVPVNFNGKQAKLSQEYDW